MSDVVTVTVRYESGHCQDIDVPPVGTMARELFDDHVATGRYTILDDEPTPASVDPDGVPSGSIGDVTAWVRGATDDEAPADGWHERATLALETERAAGTPRTTLVALLESVVGS